MKTVTKDCADQQQQSSRKRTCLTCELGEFCRNHYYRGKLLTERDFTSEQLYFMNKARLHNLALHGWGVVCGLKVKPHPYCPDRRIVLEPGLAIDSCGREIRVLKEVEIALPQPPPTPKEKPCPDEPPHEAYHGGAERHEIKEDGEKPNEPPADDEEHPCDGKPAPVDLYLSIRYAECDTEFSPAPFDDCGCNTDGQQPNRICEGYDLSLVEEKPKWWDESQERECGIPDCERLFRDQEKHCLHVNRFPGLPLALIRCLTPGGKVTPEHIDNRTRVTMASTSTLESVVRCILDKLPTKEMTHIVDINWEHGQRLLCHQFMSEFVGSERHPRGFEIRFDSRVYARSIDSRSFQAMVIFRPEDISMPREMELAPAHIEHEEFETEWCRLRIDPGYARRRLDGRNFDLFITLKCNVITGRNGLAVDGDFLATQEADDVWRMVLPTGNNVAGGTFESWIRVRPRPKSAGEEPRRSL